jgi:hypothetical protein
MSFTDQEAFDRADVVFTGIVAGIEDPRSGSSMAPRVFTFAVDDVYKGDAAPQQVVRSEQSGASCGLELAGPGPFVVFATTSVHESSSMRLGQGELHASLCGGTRPLSAAEPLATSLTVDVRPPDPDIVIEPPASTASILGRVLAVVTLVGAAAAAFALAVRLMRRRASTTP